MGGKITHWIDELRPGDFAGLRLLAGIDRTQAAALLGVSERTAQRYDRHGAPAWIMQHLELYARGQVLPAEHWDGWRFNGKWLVSPEGIEQTPGDIRAAWFERQELAARRCNDRRPAQFVLL